MAQPRRTVPLAQPVGRGRPSPPRPRPSPRARPDRADRLACRSASRRTLPAWSTNTFALLALRSSSPAAPARCAGGPKRSRARGSGGGYAANRRRMAEVRTLGDRCGDGAAPGSSTTRIVAARAPLRPADTEDRREVVKPVVLAVSPLDRRARRRRTDRPRTPMSHWLAWGTAASTRTHERLRFAEIGGRGAGLLLDARHSRYGWDRVRARLDDEAVLRAAVDQFVPSAGRCGRSG